MHWITISFCSNNSIKYIYLYIYWSCIQSLQQKVTYNAYEQQNIIYKQKALNATHGSKLNCKYIFFFNTIYSSRSIKITDNLIYIHSEQSAKYLQLLIIKCSKLIGVNILFCVNSLFYTKWSKITNIDVSYWIYKIIFSCNIDTIFHILYNVLLHEQEDYSKNNLKFKQNLCVAEVFLYK